MRDVFGINVYIRHKNFFGRRDNFDIERIFPLSKIKYLN